MTRSRAILAATSIAAAAALLVAGCDDDPPATPSPETTAASESPSASPSPSATAVVVAPERPKEMDDDGPAGAEAAAVYFLELDPYIMKTGDTAKYEEMSSKSCTHCSARIDQANEIAEQGDQWHGGDVKARVVHTYEQEATTEIWPMDVAVRISPVSVTDTSGSEVFSEAADTTESRVEMARRDGQWVVVEVRTDQSS
ncbi:DUF6318 family protein [Isoptericola sp. NPDC056618]|uniref:DUF6318 family protein n=1 Tax=Isoptericola sp. NPDC056618 TaxID=3345878 RepID=UPI0036CF023F